ncbi:hypothetical protein NAT51_14125 [Flavobacterium amniphilum]|uniref:hypothetical protein n=1 Tax=Flavobacterium amniphilum TaxID=1834035 RepID=UPI00202A016F|nr:hypothetical protein [Flavobacterium amniphilum]MCL9806669.1 hypothetical protein [Flavobacterium amniphilum]
MKNLALLLFLLSAAISYGQDKYDASQISSKTKKIVGLIAKENTVTGRFIGYSGNESEQYKNFEKLMLASTKELLNLTNHPNGAVRSYAFWALCFRSNVDLFGIVKNHMSDTEVVEYQSGCIASGEKVGDFFVRMVTSNYENPNRKTKTLTEAQRKELDSLLIYSPNDLSSRYRAIENAEPSEQLYPVLKNLYTTTHNQSALLKLSEYKKETDIPLILSNREENKDPESGYYYTYKAMQNFPRTEYIPFLELRLRETLDETGFSNEWQELYTVIAAFKNQKALELLSIPLTEVKHNYIKGYHLDFIYDAVLDNYDPLYAELLWKIWESGQNINVTGYLFYLENNLQRAYKQTVKEFGIEPAQSYNNLVYNQDIVTEKLSESMLNLILLNDKKLANEIIKLQILNSDVHGFKTYTAVIKKDKDQIFVKPLLERFAKENNPHVYLEIAKTLIAYQDKSINEQIIAVRKLNRGLIEDWGGEELTELLEKHNIR